MAEPAAAGRSLPTLLQNEYREPTARSLLLLLPRLVHGARDRLGGQRGGRSNEGRGGRGGRAGAPMNQVPTHFWARKLLTVLLFPSLVESPPALPGQSSPVLRFYGRLFPVVHLRSPISIAFTSTSSIFCIASKLKEIRRRRIARAHRASGAAGPRAGRGARSLH